jgi:hypothetical protein
VPAGDIRSMRIIPLLAVLTLAMLGSAARARAARDADRPLLVVVEVGPGLGVGASDVRQAVAAELGKNVIGTREASADGATDVLLVVLDPGEIRMSLRAGAAPIISRAIAAPPDRRGRLESIGWLAGNLVRDQVGPIVATREAPAALPVSLEPPALAESAPSPDSPAPAPVSPGPPSVPPGPAAVAASSPAIATAAMPHAVWSLTLSGGPVGTILHGQFQGSSAFQLDVQRQRSPDSLLYGVGFIVGPDLPRHYIGAAAFAGEAWRGQTWFAEATLGLGFEMLDGYAHTVTTTGTAPTAGNPGMVTSFSEADVASGPAPGLFVLTALTGGFHLSRAFDLVARLSGHLSSNGGSESYLGATAGVRLRLP